MTKLPIPSIVSNEHIQFQKERFFTIIRDTFGNRQDRTFSLMGMYHDLEELLISAPASSRVYFHNAYPGGYLDHVLNVIDASERVEKIYREMGGLIDYTLQERVFAAMHHDLGKLGEVGEPYYIPLDDEKSQNNGVYYKRNKSGQMMSGYDRVLYLFNLYGISFTKNELLAIKMADGLFSDEAKSLFMNNDVFPHTTSLPYIIHWADWMAATSEKDQMRKLYQAS